MAESDRGLPRLGVGDPMEALGLEAGEVVLDLGSGPGRDVLFAAEQVGRRGQAIGVDATPEMVFRAREAAASLRRTNAEFRLGEIEHLPIESGTVDAIASDCVINLSPDKAQVFREAFRVLKPGGRIVVSDVVADRELPSKMQQDTERWAACEAGAVTRAEYVALMRRAGFDRIRTERKGAYRAGLSRALVRGVKPHAST
ncbi:MAG TPA: methyltransferase domain-containing protein [Thermoplasmata archaeon]|nr:methyltransferase domain-containing protein [Thermoplasmata archaeon]